MRFSRSLCLAAALLSAAVSGLAQNYSSVVVFGDSLSDTGNDLHLFNAKYFGAADFPVPSLGYTRGRFTDGTDTSPAAVKYTGVWVEQLAASLPAHPSVTDSLDGGTNYAYGYAQTGTGTSNLQIAAGVDVDVNNMTAQVDTYLAAQPHVPAGTLVVVWGGANDLLAAASASTPQQAQTIITGAVGNEAAIVQRLISAGATDILVVNLPPLGLIPRLNANPTQSATATAAAQSFNTGLQAALSAFPSNSPAHIYQLDTFTLFSGIVAAPATYNLVNVTSMSQNSSVNPDQYLFWDDLHPTTTGHHLLAAAALALLTPAPVTTTTTVTSSALSSNLNSSVTFTATVTSSAGVPSGTVTFLDGTTSLGTGTLAGSGATSSTATFSTSALTTGTHSITAQYAGAAGFAASTSAAITQTVVAPDVTATLSPTSATVSRGDTATTAVTLTPVGGFNGIVQVSCGTLPMYAVCTSDAPLGYSFSNSSSPQTANITIYTDNRSIAVPAMLLLPLAGVATFAFTRRRALRVHLLTAALVAASCLGLLGLSGCSDSGKRTPSGTYTIPIKVSPSTGSATTLNFSLVVK